MIFRNMLILTLTVLFGSTVTAVLDPSFTEWKQLQKSIEQVFFPLKEYILEVKAFLPDKYDTNPPYSVIFTIDKSTRMMMLLYSGSWSKKVGRLVWNTIKYDRGYDVAIEECDARYQAYKSFPAGGKKEQIWAWNFNRDDVELTCDGELQYYQHFDEADIHDKKPNLPETCRALGDTNIDRITFMHMKGYYIRGRPRDVAELIISQRPTTSTLPLPATTTIQPGELQFDLDYPTCNCWTLECRYCTNMECTVQHDLVNSDSGITVTSLLDRKQLNSIMFYDGSGNILGTFQWNLKSIRLTDCIACRTPMNIRESVRASGGLTTWGVSLKDDALEITIEGEIVFRMDNLDIDCPDRFNRAQRFAFYDMTCDNTFKLLEEMKAGEKITPDCAGSCVRP
jgi:hypothetical protein